MSDFDTKAVIELVLDRKAPDGSAVSDDYVMDVVQYVFEQDQKLGELLCIARYGTTTEDVKVSWDVQGAALRRLERLAAAPTEQPWSPEAVTMVEELVEARPTRQERRAVTGVLGDSNSAPARHPKLNLAEVRNLLEDAARGIGWDPADLLRPVGRGRPRKEDAARRVALAEVVRQTRANGARLELIGRVVGISKQRVADLAE